MLDTKTFTWRLRPHVTRNTTVGVGASDVTSNLNPARNSKSTNLSGVSRLLNGASTGMATVTNASHSLSSSVLPSAHSLLQLQQQQQQLEKFLRYQEFEVEAGQGIGLHSMWSLFLVSCGSSAVSNQRSSTNLATGGALSSSSSSSPTANSDFIGLFLRKVLKPSKHGSSGYASGDEIIARYKIEIMDREGDILYSKEFEAGAKDKFEVGFWDWKKIVPVSKFYTAKGKLPTGKDVEADSEEALLLLRVSFTVMSRRKENKKGSLAEGIAPSAEQVSTKEAAVAFLNLVTNSKSLEPDVIVEIPNRRKFSVHKKILIDRSPLFKKMLDADSKEKTRGNIVKLDDVSTNTMELILKHIYTGQLEEEWTTNPITITELIHASEKYGLPALKEFCNKHLVKAATKNNCYKLMEVAQIHNLEQAAEDLMSYVSEGISSNQNSRKASEESVGSSDTLLI